MNYIIHRDHPYGDSDPINVDHELMHILQSMCPKKVRECLQTQTSVNVPGLQITLNYEANDLTAWAELLEGELK